jgi:hypothetical protein
MLKYHLYHENQGACNIGKFYPEILYIAGLQKDDDSIQQNNAENEFIVEKDFFQLIHIAIFLTGKNKKFLQMLVIFKTHQASNEGRFLLQKTKKKPQPRGYGLIR